MCITTTQEVPNILHILITTELLTNGSYRNGAKPSDDLVMFAISIFKVYLKDLVSFISRTDKSLDVTSNITP